MDQDLDLRGDHADLFGAERLFLASRLLAFGIFPNAFGAFDPKGQKRGEKSVAAYPTRPPAVSDLLFTAYSFGDRHPWHLSFGGGVASDHAYVFLRMRKNTEFDETFGGNRS